MRAKPKKKKIEKMKCGKVIAEPKELIRTGNFDIID